MLPGLVALVIAAAFAGVALYINVAEHPARMTLPVAYAVRQWQPSYKRGFALQATLAVVGGLCALLQWYMTGGFAWLAGGLLLIANWPFTVLAIFPTNRRLHETGIEDRPEAAELLAQWNRLHGVRTGLGIASVGAMLIGALDLM